MFIKNPSSTDGSKAGLVPVPSSLRTDHVLTNYGWKIRDFDAVFETDTPNGQLQYDHLNIYDYLYDETKKNPVAINKKSIGFPLENGPGQAGIIDDSRGQKLTNLWAGYGINYNIQGLICNGWSNAEVTVTRYKHAINLPSFTTYNTMDANFVTKVSNNQIKFVVDGLYFVLHRFSVKSPELFGKIDVCPYVNGTAVRMLAVSNGNQYVTNTYLQFQHAYLVNISAGDTFDIRCWANYDEVSTTCRTDNIAIYCLDSSALFKLTNKSLSNRDDYGPIE